MVSRRTTLSVLAGGISVAVAGCTSTLPFVGGDDEEYADWLGPNLEQLPAELGYGEQTAFIATKPADVVDNDHLDEQLVERWGEEMTPMGGDIVDPGLDPSEVELRMSDMYATWDVAVGSFSFDEDDIAEPIDHQDQYEEFDVYVTEGADVSHGLPDAPSELDSHFEAGVAFDGGRLLIVYAVADAEEALEGMIDVYDGTADRYVETNDDAATAVDEVGGGTFVQGDLSRPEPLLQRLDVDGEMTSVSALRFVEDAETAESLVPSDDELEELREEAEDDFFDRRQPSAVFAPYDEVSVEAGDRYLLVTGELPTEEVQLIDTNVVDYVTSQSG